LSGNSLIDSQDIIFSLRETSSTKKMLEIPRRSSIMNNFLSLTGSEKDFPAHLISVKHIEGVVLMKGCITKASLYCPNVY
jgi:hypothetical protein